MNIISHRGCWSSEREGNSLSALCSSLQNGFGLETDLRDLNGVVVISHDMPQTSSEPLLFDEFLDYYRKVKTNLPLALNIKSDGLQKKVKASLDAYNVDNYRLFDMSIPDQKITRDHGLKFLSRLSDIEPQALMIEDSSGVWLDAFYTDWFGIALIDEFLAVNKEVWIVSPELHGRDHQNLWSLLKSYSGIGRSSIFLCTDFPLEAQEYYNE